MRADRLVSLMLILHTRGSSTAQELAKELEVSERTIYRDIEALSGAGIPLFALPGNQGGIFLDESYRVALTGLTPAEVQSVFIASSAAPLKELGMARTAAGTFLKLLSALPGHQRKEVERYRQRIYIDPAGWFENSANIPLLPLLQQAVWEDRILQIRYQHAEGTLSTRTVEALGLVAKSSTWYLVARQPGKAVRTYRVDRIQTAELSDAVFQRSPDFDLPAEWQSQTAAFEQQFSEGEAPVAATLRIHPQSARMFTSSVTGRYEILEREDPQGWVTLRVQYPSQTGARMSILAFGSQIEVLSPAGLREHIRAAAGAVQDLYG